MPNFFCNVKSCRYNDLDGGCKQPYGPTITEDVLTAAGFLPMCEDYKEKEGVSNDA